MRKTKIVATIGPASDNKETVTRLVEAGLDVARLNLSHGDYEEHSRKIEIIREVEDDTGKTIGIMLDTRGPEVRTGPLEEDKEIFLYTGDEIVLTIDDVTGTKERISVSYKELTKDVKKVPKSSLMMDCSNYRSWLLKVMISAVKY